MSPEHSIWLLSLIGALLFIGVGFFGARASAKEGPQVEPRPAREEPREDVRAELTQMKAKLEAHRNEVLVLRQEKMALARSLDEAEQRARAKPEDHESEKRMRDAERRALEAEMRARDGEMRAREAEVRAQDAATRAQDAETRAHDAELQARAEPEPPPDLDLELAAARGKLADLDRLREENTHLRSMAAESSRLRTEVERLEAEQQDLKARAFAQPMEQPKELPVVPSMPGAFEKIVTEVARSSHARSVAIADELGFTIAGTGAEHEGLAALCGLLGEVERRAQLLLPVGAVRRITLEMDHGAGVSVCPIARSDTRIALATLTVGPRPDTVSLTGAIEQASELLFR